MKQAFQELRVGCHRCYATSFEVLVRCIGVSLEALREYMERAIGGSIAAQTPRVPQLHISSAELLLLTCDLSEGATALFTIIPPEEIMVTTKTLGC